MDCGDHWIGLALAVSDVTNDDILTALDQGPLEPGDQPRTLGELDDDQTGDRPRGVIRSKGEDRPVPACLGPAEAGGTADIASRRAGARVEVLMLPPLRSGRGSSDARGCRHCRSRSPYHAQPPVDGRPVRACSTRSPRA